METQQRIKVLFISKWFMNRHDPQLGVFIRKHASAASLYCDVMLMCVMSDASQKNLIEMEEKVEKDIMTLMVYFRKFSSPVPILNSVINFFRYLRANRHGLKQAEKKLGRHDITHAYIMLRPALVAWWLKITKGIPFVVSEQWSGYATGKFSEMNPLVKILYRWIFRQAGAATAVSGFLESKMEEAGLKNDYTITPNIVESSEKKISPLPSNNKIKIITVADLVDEIKNISSTIKAVAKIAGSYKEVEFHIVGHGKDEAYLKNLARDLGLLNSVVFFHGVKTNEEVFQFLYASDFLVMNSRFETFSLICIEAMSCGIPVIATRCGGPEEFITSENGMLIEKDNPEELTNALQKMLARHNEYDRDRLIRFAIVNYSAAETGKKFLEIYRKLLGR